MKINVNNRPVMDKLRIRIRLDYRAEEKYGHFLFGNKSSSKMAEEMREQQIYLLKNVPLQGVTIENYDTGLDIYTVLEDYNRKKKEAAYAPLLLDIQADSVEDIFPLLLKPEFRKIELLSPENLNINRNSLERLLYQISVLNKKENA